MNATLCKFSLLTFLLLSVTSRISAEEARLWTNHKGESIHAKLLDFKDGEVKLLKGNKSFILPLDSLSDADQNYVTKWANERAKNLRSNPAENELKISKKGKLLYETNFKDLAGWRVSSGDWVCGDGALTATQSVGKAHKAHLVIGKPKPVDVIIECEIYLGKGSGIAFTIDDRPKKLGMISFGPNGFGGQALHRIKSPAIRKRFSGVKQALERDKWYHISIEMIGNKISVTSMGHQISSIDDIWAGKPKRLGLRVTGGPSKYRNLKMWAALPIE